MKDAIIYATVVVLGFLAVAYAIAKWCPDVNPYPEFGALLAECTPTNTTTATYTPGMDGVTYYVPGVDTVLRHDGGWRVYVFATVTPTLTPTTGPTVTLTPTPTPTTHGCEPVACVERDMNRLRAMYGIPTPTAASGSAVWRVAAPVFSAWLVGRLL